MLLLVAGSETGGLRGLERGCFFAGLDMVANSPVLHEPADEAETLFFKRRFSEVPADIAELHRDEALSLAGAEPH